MRAARVTRMSIYERVVEILRTITYARSYDVAARFSYSFVSKNFLVDWTFQNKTTVLTAALHLEEY